MRFFELSTLPFNIFAGSGYSSSILLVVLVLPIVYWTHTVVVTQALTAASEIATAKADQRASGVGRKNPALFNLITMPGQGVRELVHGLNLIYKIKRDRYLVYQKNAEFFCENQKFFKNAKF